MTNNNKMNVLDDVQMCSDCVRVFKQMKAAINACIRRPMGVVPDIAVDFYEPEWEEKV